MRELLKLDFQRLFDGVLFKLALGVCAVLGIWDLVLNVQAHYANMEALKTQTIAYSYPSSVTIASPSYPVPWNGYNVFLQDETSTHQA